MIDKYNVGMYTSDGGDDLLKATSLALSELVELETIKQMEFVNAVNQRTAQTLDLHLTFNKNDTMIPFEINEAAHAAYQKMEFFGKNLSLQKWRVGIEMTDETRIRLDQANQLINSIQNAAESFADARDNDILRTFLKSAGIKIDASNKWNTGNADISGDFGKLVSEVFKKADTNIKESEISNITIYYPLMLLPYLKDYSTMTDGTGKLQINMSDYDYTGKTYGINWVGSRKLNFIGKALAVIKTPRTADHYTYTGGQIPEVETDRDKKLGVDLWMMTKYFGTFVYPQNYEQQETNDRIMIIDKVCDPVVVNR